MPNSRPQLFTVRENTTRLPMLICDPVLELAGNLKAGVMGNAARQSAPRDTAKARPLPYDASSLSAYKCIVPTSGGPTGGLIYSPKSRKLGEVSQKSDRYAAAGYVSTKRMAANG